MKMQDLMKREPLTVNEVTNLGDAARLMAKFNLRHLPVVRGTRLCGILSERDILRYRAIASFREDWWRAPVTAAMVAQVQTANPDDSLTEVAARMAASKIGALPIVQRGELIGLVTVTDVLDAEVREAMH